MKPISAATGVILLAATFAYADPGVIIRERAKELRDQNNARQVDLPPSQGGVPAQPVVTPTAPTAPAAPTISAGLLRFNTHAAAIHADSMVTDDQKQKLTQDLLEGAQGPKPSLASATKLVADLCEAFAGKPLPAATRARFIQELDAVMNPGKYPMAKLEGIIGDVQTIFQQNGLARMKALAIADDVKKVADEIRKGG